MTPTGLARAPATQVRQRVGAARAERTVKRLLVADDSAPMRAILLAMLRADDSTRWEVVEAASGIELLDAVAEQAPFDVVVLDVQMPGMDGFSACRVLRELNRELPVLFVTAEGDPGSFAMGRAVGGDSYLVKPFSASGLRTALHVLTNVKRRQTANAPATSPSAGAGADVQRVDRPETLSTSG